MPEKKTNTNKEKSSLIRLLDKHVPRDRVPNNGDRSFILDITRLTYSRFKTAEQDTLNLWFKAFYNLVNAHFTHQPEPENDAPESEVDKSSMEKSEAPPNSAHPPSESVDQSPPISKKIITSIIICLSLALFVLLTSLSWRILSPAQSNSNYPSPSQSIKINPDENQATETNQLSQNVEKLKSTITMLENENKHLKEANRDYKKAKDFLTGENTRLKNIQKNMGLIPETKGAALIHFKPITEQFIKRRNFNQSILYGLGDVRYISLGKKPNILKVYRTWKNKQRWPGLGTILEKNNGIYLCVSFPESHSLSPEIYHSVVDQLKAYADQATLCFVDNQQQDIVSLPLKSSWINWDWDQLIKKPNAVQMKFQVPQLNSQALKQLGNTNTVFIKLPEINTFDLGV